MVGGGGGRLIERASILRIVGGGGRRGRGLIKSCVTSGWVRGAGGYLRRGGVGVGVLGSIARVGGGGIGGGDGGVGGGSVGS